MMTPVLRATNGATLVLLHGLGATARVWDGLARLADARWPGRWIAPDLAGHGRAPHLRPYSFGRYAAEVAALLYDHRGADIHVVGHSMGGVVALVLASGWFGLPVRSAVGLGIGVSWAEEEVAKAAALATRDVRWFPTRDEAVERYLRVSGLAGVLDPADPAALDGVARGEHGWRPAQDPATFEVVVVPDMPRLLAAARGAAVLAAGEHDRMARIDDLRALQPEAVCLPGLGHNAHVEDPEAVWSLVTAVVTAAGRGRPGGAVGR